VIRLAATLLVALTLAGCARQTVQPQASELTEHWSFTGRMAIRNDSEASSFSVDWQQKAADFDINLSGPLGQGAVVISGQPGLVTLTRGREVWQASSLNELALEVSDLDLPLDYLQYWVRARPAPYSNASLAVDDDTGLVMAIQQAGWAVNYTAYFGEGGDALPQRIDFARNQSSGRLVIRNWIAEL
jgi:outer membrane lipoprotein LolB